MVIYGIKHIVKDHLDRVTGNIPFSLNKVSFQTAARELFYTFACTTLQTGQHLPQPLHSTGRNKTQYCYNPQFFQQINNSMRPPRGIDPTTHRTTSRWLYHGQPNRSVNIKRSVTIMDAIKQESIKAPGLLVI